MYRLINQHADTILRELNCRDPNHVGDYDWLRENINAVGTGIYQQRYKRFWAMNAAQLSPDFDVCYFQALSEARAQVPPLDVLSTRLHDASARHDGQKSLQFSFATKLLHMVNPRSPIYDSKVTRFYFYTPPPTKLPLPERIAALNRFYTFLNQEYARVLTDGLLANSIRLFQDRFKPRTFSDEKVIDSLIWAFIILLDEGGLPTRQVVYT